MPPHQNFSDNVPSGINYNYNRPYNNNLVKFLLYPISPNMNLLTLLPSKN